MIYMDKFVFFDEWFQNVAEKLNVKEEELDREYWYKSYLSGWNQEQAIDDYHKLIDQNT